MKFSHTRDRLPKWMPINTGQIAKWNACANNYKLYVVCRKAWNGILYKLYCCHYYSCELQINIFVRFSNDLIEGSIDGTVYPSQVGGKVLEFVFFLTINAEIFQGHCRRINKRVWVHVWILNDGHTLAKVKLTSISFKWKTLLALFLLGPF